jgi:hypothetical protein
MKKLKSKKKKVWEKPKLITLDFKKTYGGWTADTQEIGSYHS